jgi:hypothetical protein
VSADFYIKLIHEINRDNCSFLENLHLLWHLLKRMRHGGPGDNSKVQNYGYAAWALRGNLTELHIWDTGGRQTDLDWKKCGWFIKSTLPICATVNFYKILASLKHCQSLKFLNMQFKNPRCGANFSLTFDQSAYEDKGL